MDRDGDIKVLKQKIETLETELEGKRRQKRPLKALFSTKPSCIDSLGISISLLSKLINSSVDAIIAADKKGKLLIFNEVAGALFGYSVDEALASVDIRDLYPDDGALEIMAKLRSDAYGGSGKIIGLLVTVISKDGERIPVRMNASIVYEEEREIATIGYLRDLRNASQPHRDLLKFFPDQSEVENDRDVSLYDYLAGLTEKLHRYDQNFCIGAVRNQIATIDQVKQALVKQFEITNKTKVHVPIGRVMIQLGFIDENQRDALINLQRMDLQQMGAGMNGPEPERPAAAVATLEISADKLAATIHIEPENRDNVGLEDIHALMDEHGIAFGRVEDAAIEAYLRAAENSEEPFIVARGIPATSGKDPAVESFFNADPLGVGTTREDGTIDWKDRGKLPLVRAGDLLAEITPGEAGIGGTDIFNKEIPPPKVKSIPVKCGKGVGMSEDGTQFLARMDGMVDLSENRLSIVEAMMIGGDVGLETGHIDFNGHVEVSGCIHQGYRVSCKSLRTGDVQEAEITVSGDIVVSGGIYESKVRCNGTLQASHCRKSDIITGGDLVVEKEIVESKVESSGSCIIAEGTVIHSEIKAKSGIVARHIGKQGAKPSHLHIGVDERVKRQIKYAKSRLEQQKREVELLPEDIDKLQKECELLETETEAFSKSKGELATQISSSEAQLNLLLEKGHESESRTIRKKIEKLVDEKERIEKQLAVAKERMDHIPGLVAAKTEALKAGNDDLGHIGAELEALIERRVSRQKDIRVEVTGTIHEGTAVSGLKATLTISDDISNLYIQEKKKIEKDGSEFWAMQIYKNI